MREMKGGTRKSPGPLAPMRRPRTKMTPRSYCCTMRMAERSPMSRIRTITLITSTIIMVVSITSLLYAPAAQATRKLSPDRLAVTGPCGQALPTWAPLHQLAHHEDHACGSQEEPVVNRTSEGNGGDEPRRR